MKRDENGALLSNYQFLEEEYQDLDLYFVLSFARDNGTISDVDLKHLNEIIENAKKRNEAIEIIKKYQWAKDIEAARIKNENGEIDDNEYMDVYTPHMMRLNDRIIEYNRKVKEENKPYKDDEPELGREMMSAPLSIAPPPLDYDKIVEEDEKKEEEESKEEKEDEEYKIDDTNEYTIDDVKDDNLSEEYKLFLNYLKLSELIDKKIENNEKITPEEIRELNDYILTSEKAQTLEFARRLLARRVLSQDEYELLVNKYKRDLISKANVEDKKEEPVKEEPAEVTQEAKDFARYLRLAVLDRRKQLPPSGKAELKELIENNDYAKTIEEARSLLRKEKITQEEFDKLLKDTKDEVFKDARILRENAIEDKVEEEIDENRELAESRREFYRYVELYKILDHRKLTPEEQEELKAIISNNLFAGELERLRWELEEGKITEESFNNTLKTFIEAHDAMKLDPPTYSDKELNKLEEDILDADSNKKDYTEEEILNKLEEDILDADSSEIKWSNEEEKEDNYNSIKKDEYLDFIYKTFMGNKDKERTVTEEEPEPVNPVPTDSVDNKDDKPSYDDLFNINNLSYLLVSEMLYDGDRTPEEFNFDVNDEHSLSYDELNPVVNRIDKYKKLFEELDSEKKDMSPKESDFYNDIRDFIAMYDDSKYANDDKLIDTIKDLMDTANPVDRIKLEEYTKEYAYRNEGLDRIPNNFENKIIDYNLNKLDDYLGRKDDLNEKEQEDFGNIYFYVNSAAYRYNTLMNKEINNKAEKVDIEKYENILRKFYSVEAKHIDNLNEEVDKISNYKFGEDSWRSNWLRLQEYGKENNRREIEKGIKEKKEEPVKEDEPVKDPDELDDDDKLKIMREALDHYIAYKEKLAMLGMKNIADVYMALNEKDRPSLSDEEKGFSK